MTRGSSAAPPEQVRVWHPAGLPGLQMMQATYVTTTFTRHTHEGFGVGVIERGALGFYYRGENVVAPEGRINLVNPGEVHTGHSATETGWSYRMFYFEAGVLQRAAAEMADRPAELPFFASGVLEDPELATLIHRTHRRLEDESAPLLERQTLFMEMLARLISRHGDRRVAMRPVGSEHRGVRLASEHIAANFADEMSVDELAAIAGLSPYHFIRVFRGATGMPPHAWLMQYRARMAAALLRQGVPIADAACRAGFADQSHLNRVFKRLFGYTPGQYSNSVQDA